MQEKIAASQKIIPGRRSGSADEFCIAYLSGLGWDLTFEQLKAKADRSTSELDMNGNVVDASPQVNRDNQESGDHFLAKLNGFRNCADSWAACAGYALVLGGCVARCG